MSICFLLSAVIFPDATMIQQAELFRHLLTAHVLTELELDGTLVIS